MIGILGFLSEQQLLLYIEACAYKSVQLAKSSEVKSDTILAPKRCGTSFDYFFCCWKKKPQPSDEGYFEDEPVITASGK